MKALYLDLKQFEFEVQKRIYFLQEELQVKSGDRVALYFNASGSKEAQDYLCLIFALYQLEALVILLSHRYPLSLVDELKEEYKITHLLTKELLNKRKESEFLIPQFSFDELLENNKKCQTLIFSSGSTGKPKGILLNAENFYWSAKGTNEFYQLNSLDIYLLSLPLFHVGGLLIPWRTFLAKASLLIPASLQNEDLASSLNLKQYPVSFSSFVPTQLIRLLKLDTENNLSKLRYILLGGAPCPAWVPPYCQDHHIPLSLTYGMSESSSQVLASLGPLAPMQVLPYREVTLSPLDQEILVRGKILSENQTEWFHTKDIGEIKENKGWIILGRKDLMFISGGENIYPQLIEEKLKEIPWICDALVVPVPHPEWGEIPYAFIDCDKEISSESIKEQLRPKLPTYALPHSIYFAKNDQNNLKWNRLEMKKIAEKLANGD